MSNMRNQILTVPNLLTLFRLLLIPILIVLYLSDQNIWIIAGVLALSGLTDIADGFIARHFNMVSDLGKALDPVADKLTQGAILFCLGLTYPLMWVIFLLLAVKEIVSGIMGAIIIRRTQTVYSAEWHGKLTTVLLYCTAIVHVLWQDIPPAASRGLILLCVGMMLLSFLLYLFRNIRILRACSGSAGTGSTELS